MPNRTIRSVSVHAHANAHVPVRSPVGIFAGGMGRTLDLGGALDRYHPDHLMETCHELRARRLATPTGPEADAAAIARDWNAVGQLFYHAIGRFEEEAGPAQTGQLPNV